MPSFHSNHILFYIPGWTLLKTKIHTEAWMNLSLNSEIKRPVTIWVLLSLDGTWGGAFQGEGPVSAASGMLSLCLGGKFAYNPEAIYSFPSFRETSYLYHSILIIILACSLGSQIGWNSEQDTQKEACN